MLFRSIELFPGNSEKLYQTFQQSGNLAAVLAGDSQDTVQKLVGTERSSQSGSSTDTTMKSSIELFQVMTASNWVVLGALQSMHARLKEGK